MRLPVILLGELMAGMALGMVWPMLTAAPPPVPQTAMTAVRAPVPVVPPAPALPTPAAVAVPPPAPRNPFGPPHGIDTRVLQPAAPTGPAPVTGTGPVPPPSLTVPTSPGGAAGDPFAGADTPVR